MASPHRGVSKAKAGRTGSSGLLLHLPAELAEQQEARGRPAIANIKVGPPRVGPKPKSQGPNGLTDDEASPSPPQVASPDETAALEGLDFDELQRSLALIASEKQKQEDLAAEAQDTLVAEERGPSAPGRGAGGPRGRGAGGPRGRGTRRDREGRLLGR